MLLHRQASAVLLLFGFAVDGPSSMPAKKKGGAGGKPSWTPVTAPTTVSLHPARSAR